ncbi:MAG: hypothetical protein IKP50_02770 [Bacilli bacterium]|nr:hypothetical protein [Bacilli bacterium]
MKKGKLIFLLPIVAMLFSGCKGKDNSNNNNNEEQQQQQTDKTFTGLSFNNSTYTYDGQEHSISVSGELPEGATVSYGESGNSFSSVGDHVITATITCNGYTTLTLTATLTINPAELPGSYTFVGATVTYDAQPHSISVTGDIPEGAVISYGTEGNTFTLPGSHVITATVTMEGYTSWTGTATLTIVTENATESFMVADFEGFTNNDLYDQFVLEYYGDSGWTIPNTASLEVYKNQVIGDGTNTMRMNLTHQGRAFKATIDIEPLTKKYNGFAIDTFIDGRADGASTDVKVQFWFKDLPLPERYSGYKNTYATYTLSKNASTNWTHWEIPLDDETLSIASSTTITAAFKTLGLSAEELSVYIDKVAVIMTPNYIANGNIKTYVDNIKLIRTSETRKEQRFVKLDGRVYTIASADGTVFKLTLNGENSRIESLNLMNNISFPCSTSVEGDELTLTAVPANNKSIVFKMDIAFNGNVLTFSDDPTGDIEYLAPIASHIDFEDKHFEELLRVDDFESYQNSGQGFDSGNTVRSSTSGLRGQYYGDMYSGSSGIPGKIDTNWNLLNASGWPDYIELANAGHNGKCLKFRNHSSNQVRYMTMGLAFGNALAIGRGSNFSCFMKSTANNQKLALRVWYVKGVTALNQGYEGGDCKFIKDIPISTEWTRISIPLDPNREVFGIMITPTKSNEYFYVDDMILHGEGDPLVEFAGIPKDYYIYNNSTDAYKLNIDDSFASASLLNCADGTSVSLDFELNETTVTLKDSATSGANLTISGTLDNDSNISVTSVTGTNASNYSFVGNSFSQYVDLAVNFEDGSGSGTYTNEHWSEKKYTSSWNNVNPVEMNSEEKGGSKAISFNCDQELRKLIYTPELPFGPVNHFDIDLGNDYFFASGAIQYKIAILDASDNVVSYIAGTEGNSGYVEINSGSALAHVGFDFTLSAGYKLEITAKCDNGFAILYFDNLALSYL